MASTRNHKLPAPARLLMRLGIATFITTLVLYAQATPEPMPQRGIQPTGEYIPSHSDVVNVVNGNLTFTVPLASLPSGPAGISAAVGLTYNSQIYDIDFQQQYSPNARDVVTYSYLSQSARGGGWSRDGGEYGFNYGLTLELRPGSTIDCLGTEDNWKRARLKLITPDGSHHILHLYRDTQSNPPGRQFLDVSGDGYYEVGPTGASATGCPQTRPATGDLTYHTTDGTYIKVVIAGSGSSFWTQRQWTAYFPDGRIVRGYGTETTEIEDRNGNKILVTRTVSGTTTQTRLWYALPSGAQRDVVITRNGWTDQITQTGADGTPLTSTVNWSWNALSGTTLQYRCSEYDDYCPSSTLGSWVITSVQLPTPPDGSIQQYGFEYAEAGVQSWGELRRIVFPAGNSVRYRYQSDNAFRVNYTTENPVSQKILSWTDTDGATVTETTSYSFGTTSSVVTNPDGSTLTHRFYDPHIPSNPKAGLVYRIQQPDGSAVERTWYLNRPYGAQGINPANPYIAKEFRSVASGGSPVKAAPTITTLNKNGVAVNVAEYDWNAYASITRTPEGWPDWSPVASAARTTARTPQVTTALAGSGSESIADSASAYWNPSSMRLRNLISAEQVNGAGVGSQTVWSYSPTGDVTAESRLNSATGLYETTSYSYDGRGNRTSVTNPRGFQTTNTYDANNCLTQTVVSGLRTFMFACAGSWGLRSSETDAGQGIARSYAYDRFGRRVQESESGGGLSRKTVTTYQDGSRRTTVASDLNNFGDGLLVTTNVFDQLGRLSETTAPDGVKALKRYRSLPGGYRYEATSNPHVNAASEGTMGWTRLKYDANGRNVEVRHFAGSSPPWPWGTNTAEMGASTAAYSAETTTTVDAAGVSRSTSTDALGRITSATDAASSVSYTWDVRDNVLTVAQGSTVRSFTYSSLGRLMSAANPENGTIHYSYDGNGNIASRIQRGITTGYAWDALDQLTQKTYTDGTPAVAMTYSAGRLTTSSAGSTVRTYSYDGLGRVATSAQTTGGVVANFTYTRNLADGLTSVTLPSGRQVSYGVGNSGLSLGKPISVTGTLMGISRIYASSISYAPHGPVAAMTLGNGLAQTQGWNSRLQPTAIQIPGLLSLSYAYGTTNNNGNVLSQSISRPGFSQIQSYTYDAVNRLTAATEPGWWTQGYGYDSQGNRWVNTHTGLPSLQLDTPQSASWFGSNNRVQNWYYDGSGNLLQPVPMPQYYEYDAENRIVRSTVNSIVATYEYDGEGRRVRKVSPWTTTVYAYDADGHLSAEYSTAAVSSETGASWLTQDMLGSTRLTTNGQGQPTACIDYLPFGQEIAPGVGGRSGCYVAGSYPSQSTPATGDLFTGQRRDSESGLDYFGARYFSAGQGRWSSPDPINITKERLLNPSNTLNKYAYAANNPLKYIDPDGRDITIFYQPGFPAGHVMMAAHNQQTNDFAFLSVGPQRHRDPAILANPVEGVPGTSAYKLPQTADELRHFGALTIQTTPEIAQQAIEAIRNGAGTGNWALLGNNCTSSCAKVLHELGLSTGSRGGMPWTPTKLWSNLNLLYGKQRPSAPVRTLLGNTIGGSPLIQPVFKAGTDAGNPRYTINSFDFIIMQLKAPMKACVTIQGPNGPERDCQ